ncbi:lipase/thioesterase family protein [Aspergillus heteromorphus CBS 117.55]|uniref:Lipase/thioesterase family protein n=1 Tax=Aspergillus heteromorphus CBS 117.55 TaxID=1448321 RepID=A0A317VL10_9EURO|nr:lipase/thioesterase family protein [Aspergillus heteromorphus CBS 117.55]PWY74996.1 lipase/thioesterase family protein [Aspergillus heteromorphus CBS 117.55]
MRQPATLALSLAEKLDFLPALASIVLAIFWAALTALGRSKAYPKTLALHIGYAAFRKATARLSVAQMQYALPTTNKTYDHFMRKRQLPRKTVNLGDGAQGHWIGDEKADNILIWYHGGGFALPANTGYFNFFTKLIAATASSNKSLAVFTLTYTLAPQATYPTQIRQAVSALRHVLDHAHHPPASILLGGDSAGGNLVGAVLSHLAHPHPLIAPVPLSAPLRGAIMIAPWTSMETDYSADPIDSRGDLITPAVAGPWSQAYLGGAPRDYYTDLSTAPADWYASFPVDRVLVCGGGCEILLPVIRDFVEKFRAGFSNVELCVGAGEGHVAPIYNLYIGDRDETAQGKRVVSWLREFCV